MQIELTDAERLFLTLAAQNQIVMGQLIVSKLNPQQQNEQPAKPE